MQQIGWALLAVAVILQLVAAQQHAITYAGPDEVNEAGNRRARRAGLASAAAMAVASMALYVDAALDAWFLIGVGVFVLAVIVNEAVRWGSQRRFDDRTRKQQP